MNVHSETLRRLLDPAGLLFVRNRPLSAEDERGLGRWLFAPGDLDLRTTNLYVLLPLLHAARTTGSPEEFIAKVFLPWVGLIHSLAPHRAHVEDAFAALDSNLAGSHADLVHQVKLYREIVADLLDPYLTLPVACFQWLEGKFTSLEAADFGASERSKAEYLGSRIKLTDPTIRLLSGYSPTVRNAVSHAGSHGVVYEASAVIFREIERGNPPKVKGTTRWSADELVENLYRLWECVVSIDTAQDLFGFDCLDLIHSTWELKALALHHGDSPEGRAMLRKKLEDSISALRTDQMSSQQSRLRELGQILAENFRMRSMPASALETGKPNDCLRVRVPASATDLSLDNELVNRAIQLLRYVILARAVYGDLFSVYETVEVACDREVLRIRAKGTCLDEYAEERAGLLDLIHEAEVYADGERIKIQVDFAAVEAAELVSLGDRFPRRNRAPNAPPSQ